MKIYFDHENIPVTKLDCHLMPDLNSFHVVTFLLIVTTFIHKITLLSKLLRSNYHPTKRSYLTNLDIQIIGKMEIIFGFSKVLHKKTSVLETCLNCLNEAIQTSAQNICLYEEFISVIKNKQRKTIKYFSYLFHCWLRTNRKTDKRDLLIMGTAPNNLLLTHYYCINISVTHH